MGNGESRTADQAVAAAGFPKETGEQVLVQGKGKTANRDAQFTAAVNDVVTKLKATPHVKEVKSPYAKGNDGQLSQDGTSALVTFKLQGEDDVAKDRVDATLDATAAAQRAHPDLRIEQFGDASADKALVGRVREGLQEGRVPLAPDHADHPDPRLRLARRGRAAAAARADRGDGHDRAARPGLPDRPARRGDLLRRAARRPRGRRRLLHVLPAARDGGTRRRQGPRGGARSGRRHLRPRRADLGRHRHGRDGRHVPRGQRRLHVLRRRHDPRRRGRRARLPDRPPRDALLARPEGLDREGPRALPVGAAPSQPRRVARVGRDPRPRAQAPRDLRDARDHPVARARAAGARHPHGQPRRRRPAAQPADHADLRPHPGQVPGRPAAGLGRRPGR